MEDTEIAEPAGSTRASPCSRRDDCLAAASTFAAFVICGAVPLVPFALHLEDAALASLAATLAVFFAIGSAKSRWSLIPWWKSGLETLFIGSAAAAIAYGVGVLLGGLG